MKHTYTKKWNVNLIILLFLGLYSCSQDSLTNEILEQKIENNQKNFSINFPFSDKKELKSMILENVVDFELTRKISILELKETGLMSDMNWTGCQLSELPITIYDLNSKPRYYDFIVYDAEKKFIGTVRTYAKKEHSTVIEGVYSKTFEYNTILSKSSNSSTPTIFMDWKGDKYVGIKSKFGDKPHKVVDINGDDIEQSNIQELEGIQIIDYMEKNVLPQIIVKEKEKEKVFSNIPQSLLHNSKIANKINLSKQVNIADVRDSMVVRLEKNKKETKNYWNTLSEHEEALLEADDSEITSDSKYFGRLFRRIFSRVDKSLHYLKKYDKEKYSYRRGGWCGPWACGYIVYVNQKKDKYDFFESCAATFGELDIQHSLYGSNIFLRLFGKPLTPVEMSWSMPIASKGKIWINPIPLYQDMCAYDQIKHYGKPALRLCNVGLSLHWTLAYGAKQTGSWGWRNYYFLQIDNGAKVGIPNNAKNKNNYQRVDWWNPWLMVWD